MALIFAFLMAMSGWAGGVGGLAGGNFRGGDILFQDETRYVSPLNRTLCHDNNQYQVSVDRCQRFGGRDGDNCIGPYKDDMIFQPIESEKKGCVEMGVNRCKKRGYIRFVQDPVRVLIELDDRGEDTGVEWEYEIPQCK